MSASAPQGAASCPTGSRSTPNTDRVPEPLLDPAARVHPRHRPSDLRPGRAGHLRTGVSGRTEGPARAGRRAEPPRSRARSDSTEGWGHASTENVAGRSAGAVGSAGRGGDGGGFVVVVERGRAADRRQGWGCRIPAGWAKQPRIDGRQSPGTTSSHVRRIKDLEHELRGVEAGQRDPVGGLELLRRELDRRLPW
jgi:hypothetical protein